MWWEGRFHFLSFGIVDRLVVGPGSGEALGPLSTPMFVFQHVRTRSCSLVCFPPL